MRIDGIVRRENEVGENDCRFSEGNEYSLYALLYADNLCSESKENGSTDRTLCLKVTVDLKVRMLGGEEGSVCEASVIGR